MRFMTTWTRPKCGAVLATGAVAMEHPPPMIITLVGGVTMWSWKAFIAIPGSHLKYIDTLQLKFWDSRK